MTEVFKNSTGRTIYLELVDSTTGLPKTGIVFGDCTGSYVRVRSARTAITMATLASASAAWSSGGFILVDDTNQPGIYRLDVPDAAFATGVDEVVVTIKATGCRTVSRGFVLTDWNKQVASIPPVAAGAQNGLMTCPTTGNVLPSNSIVAASIAADAITAAKIADGAIDTATFAAGTTIPRVTLADTATNLTNLPTAPANWLTSSALATDAAGEIADAVELAILNEGDLSPVLEAIRVKIETSDDDLTVGLIAAQVRVELATELAKVNALPAAPAAAGDVTAARDALLAKLLKYVQLLARKDAAIAADNATELTAINASGGSGSGGYAGTTDSLEAIRDHGDAAWATATGFSTLDAAGVRTAVGLADADLDDQLAAIGGGGGGDATLANQATILARLGSPAGASLSADVAALLAALPRRVRKNTALDDFPFVMIGSTDHVTPLAGLTVTATRSIDGGAFAACANAPAAIGGGAYRIDLAAGDLNGDVVIFKFTATGADPRLVSIITQP